MIGEPTNLNEQKEQVPFDFSLEQNYPNPFNPTTNVSFSVPIETFVTVKIYDLLGNEIAVLVNETKTPGKYNVQFHANGFSSGVYICEMTASNFKSTQKLVLAK